MTDPNQQQQQHTLDTIDDDENSTKDILSLVLSLIGFGRSTRLRDDDSNRSLASFSSSSTKVASSASSARSSYYTSKGGDDDDDDLVHKFKEEIMLSLSSSPIPTSSSSNNNNNNDDDHLLDKSTVFVPSFPAAENPPLYETWGFQDWLQRLPKLALFHLVSTTAMQDPLVAYYLLEYQYHNDDDDNRSMNQRRNNNNTTTIFNEVKWIQRHSRAILHQVDHLRPNEQFAQVKDIADRLFSMVQLCEQHFYDHWGDSWLTVISLILVAQECFDDTPAEIRQYLFYHVKLGRTMILKINAALKHYKIYKDATTTTTMTAQQYVANHLFVPLGWRCALESTCQQLARLDDGWAFKDEYQETVTLMADVDTLD